MCWYYEVLVEHTPSRLEHSKKDWAKVARMDSSTTELENRWRLEQMLRVCERQVQRITQVVWDRRAPSAVAAFMRFLEPRHRHLVRDNAAIDSWDVTLCSAVLKHLGALREKKTASAVAAIVDASSHCATATHGRVTTAACDLHATACVHALAALGGDLAALQQLRTGGIDGRDASTLASSRAATNWAVAEKLEGNCLFRERDFVGARDAYTRGLQVAGAVDTMVLAQLHNNRATANMRLHEYARATKDAKLAAALAPQWAKPHVRLAEIYKETYKLRKAVSRLEMALGYATAARDTAMIHEVKTMLSEYRQELGEDLAYGPMHEMEGAFLEATRARLGLNATEDPRLLLGRLTDLSLSGRGSSAKKHVLLGHQATQDGRLSDAAREYMAAAMAGDPEGMYNYAICQLKGRGTTKNSPGAVGWLEKAAAMPIDDSLNGMLTNIGIGAAMASLGNLYNAGIHFPQDKRRASEYWERSAALSVNAGLNNFGLCLMRGSHGVERDLARARDLFRRSAECLHNEGMTNLAVLHASLHDYETAARWADSAVKYGFIPAADLATQYRRLAQQERSGPNRGQLPQQLASALARMESSWTSNPTSLDPTRHRLSKSSAQSGLCTGDQLVWIQEYDCSDGFTNHKLRAQKFTDAVEVACRAHRVDDSSLVFSQEEVQVSARIATMAHAAGVPASADLALLPRLTDQSAAVAYWDSLQRQFPNDLDITKRAACAHMFQGYPGADARRGIELFQRAFSLLEHPDDDSDPRTLDLLYVAGAAYFQVDDLERAECLLTRFLRLAPADGHRKGAEATYLLGLIAMRRLLGAPDTIKYAVTKYLEDGDRLRVRIPAFLRRHAAESSNRKMLQAFASLFTMGVDPKPASVPSNSPTQRRGGELVDGPRRVEALRSDSPTLQPKWRAEIATMVGTLVRATFSHRTPLCWSTQPPRQLARGRRGGSYSEATIDELFSGLEDRVCTGRVITCIVVSPPSFNGSSFQFVVEDSQREPARVAMYNAPQLLIAQLTPGREFHLLDPYVRMANDGSVMLRVDDPSATIEVKALHAVCWVCSVEQVASESKRCAKCRKAIYCSKQCQAHDWRVNGYRTLCSVVAQTF